MTATQLAGKFGWLCRQELARTDDIPYRAAWGYQWAILAGHYGRIALGGIL